MRTAKKLPPKTGPAGQKPGEPVIEYISREEVIRIDREISDKYAGVLKKLAE